MKNFNFIISNISILLKKCNKIFYFIIKNENIILVIDNIPNKIEIFKDNDNWSLSISSNSEYTNLNTDLDYLIPQLEEIIFSINNMSCALKKEQIKEYNIKKDKILKVLSMSKHNSLINNLELDLYKIVIHLKQYNALSPKIVIKYKYLMDYWEMSTYNLIENRDIFRKHNNLIKELHNLIESFNL